MIRVQDLEVLFNTSTKLHNQLNNTPNSIDSAEILTWLGELEETSNIIENLIVDFDRTNFEYKYHELSEVYLTADKLINSATFSLNKDFTNFHEFSAHFYKIISELLAKANILANRERFESREKLETETQNIKKQLSSLKDIAERAEQKINERVALFNQHIETVQHNLEQALEYSSKEIEDAAHQLVLSATNQIEMAQDRAMSTIKNEMDSIELKLDAGLKQLTRLDSSLQASAKRELQHFAENTQSLQASLLENIRSESSNAQSSIQGNLNKSINSFDIHCNESISAINKRIDDEVSAFETKRSDMDELLEKVGLAKDADVTITQANRELRSATWLRWTGLTFMCGSIALLIYFFRYYIGLSDAPQSVELPPLKELGFEFFALRFMTVILVSSPAIYLLKESASHRAKENLYRQRGTQLLTIRGYLADLSDEQRSEVKHKLAENFFSFHNGKADTSNVPDFIKNMNEAIKLAHAIKTPPTSASEKKEQTTSA